MDRIFVPGIPLSARVGAFAEERAKDQSVIVALVLHLDLAPAGESDELARTVDYDAVCEVVTQVVASRAFHLIEAIAEEVAEAVLRGFPVAAIDVRVEKPEALSARGVAYAAVEISRRGRG